VAHQPLLHTHIRILVNYPPPLTLHCPICDLPVPLETAKTDEWGRAIHEDCYVLKMDLLRASGA